MTLSSLIGCCGPFTMAFFLYISNSHSCCKSSWESIFLPTFLDAPFSMFVVYYNRDGYFNHQAMFERIKSPFFLLQGGSEPLTWEKRIQISLGLIQAVRHLHQFGIIHGNVKRCRTDVILSFTTVYFLLICGNLSNWNSSVAASLK